MTMFLYSRGVHILRGIASVPWALIILIILQFDLNIS